jgi:hypothetical protein
VLPVDNVPGAESATNDLDAQLAETEVIEFVAHSDCVAQTTVFGIKLIASARTALDAVQGTVEPVAIEFCLFPIRDTKLELSQ